LGQLPEPGCSIVQRALLLWHLVHAGNLWLRYGRPLLLFFIFAVPRSGASEVEPRMSALATLNHSRHNSLVDIEWQRPVDASSER
jgi:hypothetical protein